MGPHITRSALPEKPSKTPSEKVSSTATTKSQQEKATLGSGAPPVSIPVVLLPSSSTTSSMPSESDSFAPLPTSRTVQGEVTSTMTVTTDVPTLDAVVPNSLVGESSHAVDASVDHTSTKEPAPETTVAFQMYKVESTNHLAIAGALFGALAFILLVVLVITFFRRKNRYDDKRSQVKKGKVRSGNKPTTQDLINEALQRRKERNRRTVMFNAQASVLSPDDMSETMHQGNVMAAGYHSRSRHHGRRFERSSTTLESVQRPTHMATRQGTVRAYPISATPSQRRSLSAQVVSPMGRSFNIVDLETISPISYPNEFGGDRQTR
jgi:hypothetical protein